MRTRRILIALLLSALPLVAVPISDVAESNPNYSAIQQVVQEGYLPLNEASAFKPSTPITRLEASIILDKLLSKLDSSGATLSKADLQELSNLSRSFKALLADQEQQNLSFRRDIDALKKEQTVIQHDLSTAYGTFDTFGEDAQKLIKRNAEFIDDYAQFKQKTYDQQVYMWIGIGVAALLGLAL